MLEAVLVGCAALLFVWGLYNYLGYRKEKREIKKQYQDLFQQEMNRKSTLVKLGDNFDQSENARKIKKKLVYANIPLLPSEFIAIVLFSWFALSLMLFGFFSVPVFAAVVISFMICFALCFLLLIIRKNKYMEQLNNQLAEVCRLLGNSTRAGMTINQGLEVVAMEIDSPAKEEFTELTHNLRLGVDFERALRNLEKKVSSREFKLFISALLIQKRSGGNLTKVLSEMAYTLEERKVLRQTVKTATAEQRMVSYILPIMPIALILILNNMMDGFLELLLTIPGMILSFIFIVGMIIAMFLVRAVTNIKV